MKDFKQVIITGDTHGDFTKIVELNNPENSPVIIVGDFGGIWATSQSYIELENIKLKQLEELPYDIFFIDGNHENFDRLEALPVIEKHGGSCHQVGKNIFHMIRGELFNIEGISFFAFGGAFSHDIQYGVLDPQDKDFDFDYARLASTTRGGWRVKGVSWWPQEQPSEAEMEYGVKQMKGVGWKVDVVLTHQAPAYFERQVPNITKYNGHPFGWKFPDFLSKLLVNMEAKYWFFGHYHRDMKFMKDDMQGILLFDDFIRISKEDMKQ